MFMSEAVRLHRFHFKRLELSQQKLLYFHHPQLHQHTRSVLREALLYSHLDDLLEIDGGLDEQEDTFI